VTGKNRIMIYGPKDDGTYVVEFRKRRAGDLHPARRDARRPAFPGADALWLIRPRREPQHRRLRVVRRPLRYLPHGVYPPCRAHIHCVQPGSFTHQYLFQGADGTTKAIDQSG
jgi:hypothetical protein